MNLIIGEELASDYEEQDNTGGHIRYVVTESEGLGNLAASFLQEHDEEACEYHAEGVELGKPGDQDCGKAVTSGQSCRYSVACPGTKQESCKASDSTAYAGGPEYYFFHIYADVSGSLLAFSNYRYLVALLAVFKVDEHKDCQGSHNQDIDKVLLAEEGRDPAALGLPVKHSHYTGAVWYPYCYAELYQLDCHIVHHKGEQCLVGAELCLEVAWNSCPDKTCRHR